MAIKHPSWPVTSQPALVRPEAFRQEMQDLFKLQLVKTKTSWLPPKFVQRLQLYRSTMHQKSMWCHLFSGLWSNEHLDAQPPLQTEDTRTNHLLSGGKVEVKSSVCPIKMIPLCAPAVSPLKSKTDGRRRTSPHTWLSQLLTFLGCSPEVLSFL